MSASSSDGLGETVATRGVRLVGVTIRQRAKADHACSGENDRGDVHDIGPR